MMPSNLDINAVGHIKDVAKQGNVALLVNLLKEIPSLSDQENLASLRALELQLRLVQVYLDGKEQLASLSAHISSLEADKIGEFREELIAFIEAFGQSVNACIDSANQASFRPEAIVEKLEDAGTAPTAVSLLTDDNGQKDQAWLTSRALITKSGVQEGVWQTASELQEVVGELGSEHPTLDSAEVRGIVSDGFGLAQHELSMAVQALWPAPSERSAA